MDAILGVELDRLAERLRRLLAPSLERVDGGGEVREPLVLLLPAAAAAEVERRREITAILLEDGLEVGVLVLPPRGLARQPLAGGGEVLARARRDLRRVVVRGDLLEELDRPRPVLLVHGLERVGIGGEPGVGTGG